MSLLPDVNPITTGRAVRAVGLVGAVTLALSACAGETTQPGPAESPAEENAPTNAETPAEETSPEPSDESPAAESPTEESPPAESGGGTTELGEGESAELAHFTVTMHAAESQPDGLWEAWDIEVCYTSEHPGQNEDGTTRVSTDPWSVLARDGEGTEDYEWYPIGDFEQNSEKSPAFTETQLAVGDCTRGWLTADHGNPDLQFAGLRYAPADFDEEVTWSY